MSVERAELLRLCEQYKLSATDGVATMARALLAKLTAPDAEGIDSLRRALSISDERVREQAEEIDALRKRMATLADNYAREAAWTGSYERGALLGDVCREIRAALAEAPQQTTEGKPHAG